MIQSLAEGGRSKKKEQFVDFGWSDRDLESSRVILRFISLPQMASRNIIELMSSVKVEITDKCAVFINGR